MSLTARSVTIDLSAVPMAPPSRVPALWAEFKRRSAPRLPALSGVPRTTVRWPVPPGRCPEHVARVVTAVAERSARAS